MHGAAGGWGGRPSHRAPPSGDLGRCFAAESSSFDYVVGVIITFSRLAFISVVSRLRRFRFYRLSFAFGVGSCRGCGGFTSSFSLFSVWCWVFLCAVVSYWRLVIRVRLTTTTLYVLELREKSPTNANLESYAYRVSKPPRVNQEAKTKGRPAIK